MELAELGEILRLLCEIAIDVWFSHWGRKDTTPSNYEVLEPDLTCPRGHDLLRYSPFTLLKLS